MTDRGRRGVATFQNLNKMIPEQTLALIADLSLRLTCSNHALNAAASMLRIYGGESLPFTIGSCVAKNELAIVEAQAAIKAEYAGVTRVSA